MTCDPCWKNVGLLITGESSSGSPSYNALDVSTNALTLTGPGAAGAFDSSGGPFGNACIDLSASPVIYAPIVAGGPLDCSTCDFTIEAWIYLNSTGGDVIPFNVGSPGSSFLVSIYVGETYVDINGNNVDTGAVVSAGAWTHFAICMRGSQAYVYVNGVGGTPYNIGSRAGWSGNNLLIGGPYPTSTGFFPGKMSNVRLTKGVARYMGNFTPPSADFETCYQAATPPSGDDPNFSQVSLLLTCDGENGSGIFQDSSNNGFPVFATGVSVDTSAPQFGSGALKFETLSAGFPSLSIPVTAGGPLDFTYGTDFTVECWYKTPTLSDGDGVLISNEHTNGLPKFQSRATASTGQVSFGYASSAGLATATSPANLIAANSWYHVAFVSYGGVLTAYLNGIGGAPVNVLAGADLAAGPLFMIGADVAGNGVSTTCELDEIRVTKGLARYTANFTPPAQAFASDFVAVPNVVGDVLAAGQATLIAAGFTAGTVTSTASSSVAAGSIISQSPSGTAIFGSAVNLVSSSGLPMVSVPAVVGDTLVAATAALTAVGLTAGALTYTNNNSAAGTVLGQTTGSVVYGSSVALLLSNGIYTGNQADIQNRMNLLLPVGWFEGLVPLKDAIVTGVANGLAFIYSLFGYVRSQTRIATTTDGFLDLVAQDFFGANLPRNSGELDPSYRTRMQTSLFLEKGTRADVIRVLTQLTGNAPLIVEPSRPADCGGYGIACGYSVAGHLGSRVHPYQAFVTVARGTSTSDASLYAAVASVQPEATIVWMKLTS